MSPIFLQQEAALLDPAVRSIRRVEGDNLVSIVLFGSRARGEATPESDVDLLVVVNEASPRLDRAPELRWGLLDDRVYLPASFLVLGREEVDADVPSFLLDIALDGLVLFDKGGFMASRLERLHRIVEEAGLFRVRIGPGHFAWEWRRRPGKDWSLDWQGFHEGAR
jgi:uncharacterized protein